MLGFARTHLLPTDPVNRLRFALLSVLVLLLVGCASVPPAANPSVLAPQPWTGPGEVERAAFSSLGAPLAPLSLPGAPVLYVATLPAGDYGPGLDVADDGGLALGWRTPRPEPEEPLARLVVAHHGPMDLRVSLLLASWFARLGFQATIVDLRGFAPAAGAEQLDDRGEGKALATLLGQEPGLKALDGYPSAIIGLAMGGASAIYAAAQSSDYRAVLAIVPIPEDIQAQMRARQAIDAQPLVQAARAVTGCSLLLQTRLGADAEAQAARTGQPTPMRLLRQSLPRAQLASVTAADPLDLLLQLPDWGDVAALWLIDSLAAEPGASCPAFVQLEVPQ